MTKVTEEMVKALRRGATECTLEGVNGWGNTMSNAADLLEAMTAAQDTCGLKTDDPDCYDFAHRGKRCPDCPAVNTVQVDREDLARLTKFVRGVAKLRNVPNLADEAAAKRCESILSTEGKG